VGVLGGFAGALAVAGSAFAYTIFGSSFGDGAASPFLAVGAQGGSAARRTATPDVTPPAAATPAATTPTAAPAALEAPPAPPAATPAVESPVASAAAPPRATPAASAPAAAVLSAPAPPPVATSTPAPPARVVTVALTAREQGLVDAMNARRASAGLSPLAVSGGLTGAARSRSQDMLTNNYFAHSSPSGQTWYSLLSNLGMTYSAGGENLAKVYGDAPTSVQVAIDALMASPTHRANILNPAYRMVGVGDAVQGDGLTLLTSIFTDR
jgi:uncharacterized protein YkwD